MTLQGAEDAAEDRTEDGADDPQRMRADVLLSSGSAVDAAGRSRLNVHAVDPPKRYPLSSRSPEVGL